MNHERVKENELDFSNNLKGLNNKQYTETGRVELSDGVMIRQLETKSETYFYKDVTRKTKIVLHSTAGYLKSDINELTKANNHVSVSYLIDRLGNIYELFNPNYWSYHVGRGAIGGNEEISKSSIGIELSNYGPLKLNEKHNRLETIYTSAKSPDIYCKLSELDEYIQLPGGYRGATHFATFTNEQYYSLDRLIDYLCDRFNIPREFIDIKDRYETFKDIKSSREFTGICSHVNFIKSGKWDLGPQFRWNYIDYERKMNSDVDEALENAIIEEISTPEVVKELGAVNVDGVISEVVEEISKDGSKVVLGIGSQYESIFTKVLNLFKSLFK